MNGKSTEKTRDFYYFLLGSFVRLIFCFLLCSQHALRPARRSEESSGVLESVLTLTKHTHTHSHVVGMGRRISFFFFSLSLPSRADETHLRCFNKFSSSFCPCHTPVQQHSDVRALRWWWLGVVCSAYLSSIGGNALEEIERQTEKKCRTQKGDSGSHPKHRTISKSNWIYMYVSFCTRAFRAHTTNGSASQTTVTEEMRSEETKRERTEKVLSIE